MDKKIVVIGGGTGQSKVIRALKEDIANLSAIVTMADDGGSTGRLRKYHNAPAVGDLRQCLAAFADENKLLTRVFPHRFGNNRWGNGAQDIEGHVTGNIILVALVDVFGGLREGIAAAAKSMGIKPTHGVFPSTFDNIILKAKLKNDGVIVGQHNISHKIPRAKKFRIEKLSLECRAPGVSTVRANSEAVSKILAADLIIIGPGALHGSVLPNLLIPGIKNAVLKSKAKKVYVANTAIKLSETRGFNLDNHVESLLNHTNKKIVDLILVNNKKIQFRKPIQMLMTDNAYVCGISVVQADLIDEADVFSHDPVKLRSALLRLVD